MLSPTGEFLGVGDAIDGGTILIESLLCGVPGVAHFSIGPRLDYRTHTKVRSAAVLALGHIDFPVSSFYQTTRRGRCLRRTPWEITEDSRQRCRVLAVRQTCVLGCRVAGTVVSLNSRNHVPCHNEVISCVHREHRVGRTMQTGYERIILLSGGHTDFFAERHCCCRAGSTLTRRLGC